eukprot:scaffold390582_cov19-Prasinocladus_malaysianus.AAC.1
MTGLSTGFDGVYAAKLDSRRFHAVGDPAGLADVQAGCPCPGTQRACDGRGDAERAPHARLAGDPLQPYRYLTARAQMDG